FGLETLWDPDAAAAFQQLPGARAGELKLDPWIADQLDAFIALHGVRVEPLAAAALAELAAEQLAPREAVNRSSATTAEPLDGVARSLAAGSGGQLAPFQWAAVRYALQAR